MSTGYSGTPLVKKLGIQQGFHMLLFNEPQNYFTFFSNLPREIIFLKKFNIDVADFIHIFCTKFEELNTGARNYKTALKKDGMFWISRPKAKSNIPTDLKREIIREFMLPTGPVVIKIAAIDEDCSGLKFVYRKINR